MPTVDEFLGQPSADSFLDEPDERISLARSDNPFSITGMNQVVDSSLVRDPFYLPPEQEYSMLQQPTLELPRVPSPVDKPWEAAALSVLNPFGKPSTTAAYLNKGLEFIEGATSPIGAAATMAAPVVGPYGRLAIGGAFTAPMVADIPAAYEERKAQIAAGNEQGAADAEARLLANVGAPLLVGAASVADFARKPVTPKSTEVINATKERPIQESSQQQRTQTAQGGLSTEAVGGNRAEPSRVEPQTKEAVAPEPNLERVYKIFETEPKERASVGQVAKELVEKTRTGVLSRYRPVDRLAEDVAAASGGEPKKLSGIFEALKGSTGRSEAQVYRFDQDVSRLVKGHEKDFNAYMFVRRGLDRLKQDAEDSLKIELAAEQAGESPAKAPVENRRAISDYTIPQLETDLAALQEKLGPEVSARFAQAADAYQKHMDQSLQWQVESGRMSSEVYDAIKAGNQFYAPFKVMKYLEETNRPEGTGRRVDTPAELTKAMVGIEDPNFKLGDMLAAGRMNIRVSRILSDKHAAMRNLSELAPLDTEGRFIRKLKEGEETGSGREAVNVFEGGKQVRYEVPTDVADALQLFDTQRTGLVESILRGAVVPFRAGATAWNIPFQASNLLADIPRATLVAKTGFRGNPVDILRLPLDYAHSVFASLAGDVATPLFGTKAPKLFLDFLDSGSAGTTIQEGLTPNALRFVQSNRLREGTKLGKTVLRTLPQIATAIEQSTKIMGVKRAMRMSGQTSGDALYRNAKDLLTEVRQYSGSPDFGRQGKWVEAARLNVLVPFSNARIQGTAADLGRLLGKDGAATAAETWAKLGLAVGVPTATLYALNHRPEYVADYAQIPDKEKQNYWHIPKDAFITLEDGSKVRDYWRIPKRESSKWVANLTESSLDYFKNQSPEQAGRWMQSLLEDISPVNIQGDTLQERGESAISGINPLLKAPIEATTGRDLYRHRPIVPDSMKNASPEQQFTARTPELFKKMAEKMPDAAPELFRSPLMMENMVKNFTAGLVSQFLPGQDVKGRSEFENNPLLKRFQRALYNDDREFQSEMDSLKREAADSFLKRHRLAEQIVNDNPDPRQALTQVLKTPEADEKILRHTMDLIIAERAGIDRKDRQLLALPVIQRAEYIVKQLEGKSPEAKRQMIQDWSRKRILTEAVAQEIANQK